jgi:hypothetical protein
VSPSYSPDYWLIIIKKNKLDKEQHQGNYFFEDDSNMRLLTGGSNKFWIEVGKRLIDFFGGYIDYNDCDDIKKDFEKEKPRLKNNPNDGEEWNDFEKEKYNIKPLVK